MLALHSHSRCNIKHTHTCSNKARCTCLLRSALVFWGRSLGSHGVMCNAALLGSLPAARLTD